MHCAPIQRKQPSRDRQPEAGAAKLHRRLVACLRKFIEDAIDDIGAMPMPVSETATASVTASVPSSFVSTVTVTEPVEVNFTALPTRLERICRIATGSPITVDGTASAQR